MLVVSATLGALTFAGVTGPWLLLAFTFALGAGTALMMPAWAATTPELVPKSELQAAIALNSVGINVSRAVGPAIAGVIVSAVGSWAVFMLNALSYMGVIAALVWWRRVEPARKLPPEHFAGAFALRYVWHAPALKGTLLRSAAFFTFAAATWALSPLIVIPGLHDGHTHPIRGGLNYNVELRWDGVPSLADALRMLREQAKRTPPPQWARVVGGFTEYQFAEKPVTTSSPTRFGISPNYGLTTAA
jgi:MFS family permease